MKDHPAATHPDLVVGFGTADDAGVFALGDGRALIQTVDIFTPVVDSPGDWGRIAAANALSDLYAMGAEPMTALQYIAWPRDVLGFDLAGEVVAGGMDVMAEAGCTVVGGHSIDGPEPTYGFAVTGVVSLDEVITNAGASSGQVLVLTKPLGIGIITTAIKREACPHEVAETAIAVMSRLNRVAGAALGPHGAGAATDVTGFGLLGHLREMCLASGVGAEVFVDAVPVIEGALELLGQGMWAGGSQRNLRSIEGEVETERPVEDWKHLADAQTSGGLLAALPAETVSGYLSTVPESVVIGEVTSEKVIRLT